MCYVYTMEYYSPIKKNKVLSFVGKWLDLESIILSEKNSLKKANIICFLWFVESKFKKRHESRRGLHEGRGLVAEGTRRRHNDGRDKVHSIKIWKCQNETQYFVQSVI
jgi:hypothetical protein